MSQIHSKTITEQVRADHNEYLFPSVQAYYKNPLVLVEGHGATAIDSDGHKYSDFFSGILTTSIGHCHPQIVKKIQEQISLLNHTSTLYLNEPQVKTAKLLAKISPGSLKKCFFTNSGTEAVETAIMLARMYTGRDEIVALRYSYSGRSTLTTNMNAQASWRPLTSSIPWIKHAMSPYCYRCPFGPPHDDCAEKFARDLEEVIVTTTNGKPAAFFAETIQGAGGFIVPPAGYFRLAAEIIRRYGGLLIIDEVQTGFGRTGNKWFGIEHWGVEPDIMVMAKGIANGFPVGATIAKPEIADIWTKKTISTFGGNPLSMVAAETTLNVMIEENVPVRAFQRGAQLREGLDSLYEKHSWIGEVRGMGLMQGMEIVTDRESKTPDSKRASALMEATREEGLLVGLGGIHAHVVRIAPSLLITEEETAIGLEKLSLACQKISTDSFD